MNMKRQVIVAQDSVPEDVAINIMSFLEASDVCSLGGCSKFWRETSGSEYLWESLCKMRWPGVVLEDENEAASETHDHDQRKEPSMKGWRKLYEKKHKEMAEKAACLQKRLSCPEIDVNVYRRTLEDMKLMQFSFKDTQLFFLKPKLNVLLNLVGLHHCIKELHVQVDSMIKALRSCGVQDRKVYIQWWELGNLMHRCRAPDVLHARCIPLYDLTSIEGGRVLRMLEQGINGDVLRIQMFSAEPHNKRNPSKCSLCKGLRREVASCGISQT